MARCAKCGKMAGIPTSIPLKDQRTGSNKSVHTSANLVGNRPMMKDQTNMNQRSFSPKNPLNGKM